MDVCDVEIGHGLEAACRLDAGRRSESYIFI